MISAKKNYLLLLLGLPLAMWVTRGGALTARTSSPTPPTPTPTPPTPPTPKTLCTDDDDDEVRPTPDVEPLPLRRL